MEKSNAGDRHARGDTTGTQKAILFFISQCITLFGSQVVQMAIVWHVTLTTGSGAWVAAFSVCAYLPQFALSFPGGVWADRYDRKKLIIGADAVIALATVAMLLIMPRITTDTGLLAALLALSFLRAVGAGIQTPAVGATVPSLVPDALRMRYNGIYAAMQSAVQFAAPAAAAAVLAIYPLSATMCIDALTAVIGIALLMAIRLPKPTAAPSADGAADGARAPRSTVLQNGVGRLLFIYGAFIFLSVPSGYLAGLLVSRIYGDTVWYLTAVELVGFGGMLLGGLIMSAWGSRKPRATMLAASLLVFSISGAAMGLRIGFVPYLACMAVYGIALTSVQTSITTLLQERADASVHGRVFGLFSALYASCYPVGMLLFGPLADIVPLQLLMIFGGAALLLLTWFARKTVGTDARGVVE